MLIRLFAYLMFTISGTSSAMLANNPLSGHHLRVLTFEFPYVIETQRNATGHIIHIKGMQKHMMEALCEILNFSYSYLPIVARFIDDLPTQRGAISYIISNEADYVLSPTVATPSRFQKVDFPAYWSNAPFSTILPYPKETLSLTASLKPLSYQAWILVAIAVFATMLFLKLLQRWDSSHPTDKRGHEAKSREGVVLYVLGNLVSQGQNYFSKRFATRTAAGAWCCACFFLVQIYSTTLTSHLTSPNRKPIINSFFEIADTPGVSLTFDKGFALDVILQTIESTHIKRFVNVLKKENRFITCNTTADCLEYLERGNAVYSAPYSVLARIMADDLKNTGSCTFTRTKETFWSSPLFTMLPKNSPYTEIMSRGIMRLEETGLIAEWRKWYVPSPSKCISVNQRQGNHRLSLRHLGSSFFILLCGYLISLIAFFIEDSCKIYVHFCQYCK